jgi:hypothetical protein
MTEDCTDCVWLELIVEIPAPPIPTPLRGLLLIPTAAPVPVETPTEVLFTITIIVLFD